MRATAYVVLSWFVRVLKVFAVISRIEREFEVNKDTQPGHVPDSIENRRVVG